MRICNMKAGKSFTDSFDALWNGTEKAIKTI